ncbi:hypothetical protein [Thalassospira sp. TSL5-1]|uniref:hypothetical protein n=1 Tax=Thalassospira sp. TSL5-1 TaxID=1544451 RepID=UPI00093FE4A4|nr:hypothetical protein [Thalassospira sp. TSL5-1]OKH86990.1 hypothetical protein LF95_18500 [Thalassospira sp. TSL5-1]
MKLLRSVGVAFLVSTAFVGAYGTTTAFAQQSGVQNQLPPALRAALLSGNAGAIQQAIQVLSAGNPARQAELAQQVVAAAEQLVQSNPKAALAAAQVAVNVVSNGSVQTSAPASANNVAAIAARIIVNPNVIQAAPAQVAQVATQAVRVATSPVVYQANPTASVQVAANTHAAVNNPTVVAADPTALQQVSAVISQASANQSLNGSNSSNASQMNSILAQQQPQPQQQQQQQQTQTVVQQPQDPVGDPIEPPSPESEAVNNASPIRPS